MEADFAVFLPCDLWSVFYVLYTKGVEEHIHI